VDGGRVEVGEDGLEVCFVCGGIGRRASGRCLRSGREDRGGIGFRTIFGRRFGHYFRSWKMGRNQVQRRRTGDTDIVGVEAPYATVNGQAHVHGVRKERKGNQSVCQKEKEKNGLEISMGGILDLNVRPTSHNNSSRATEVYTSISSEPVLGLALFPSADGRMRTEGGWIE